MYTFLEKYKKTVVKEWFDHVKFFTAGWLIALMFFYFMRQVGISGKKYHHFKLSNIILYLPVFTLLSGIIFGSVHYFFEKYLVKKIPLWKLFLRLCIDQLFIIFILSTLFYATGIMIDARTLSYVGFITSAEIIIFAIYVFIVNSALNFMFEIVGLLGKGNFYKLVTGKFYTPKEEYRIFMFLDLNSSTTISEKLGHIAYSNFIKDCFYDLGIVHNYGAQIYQYVGDEAVLTWEVSKMKTLMECVNAFWAFNDALVKRSGYYKQNYSMIPEFKAGMSIGMVTVVEIGYSKKEVAYHGSTLNTAARIEGLCNIYSEKILISKKLYAEIIKEKSSYIFEKIAETRLRGKENITEIYSINRTAKVDAELVS